MSTTAAPPAPRSHRRPARDRSRGYTAGVVVLSGLFLAGSVAGWGGPERAMVVSDVAIPVAAAVAALALLVRGLRTAGRERASWLLLAAGTASSCTAEVIWAVHEIVLGQDAPFPGPPDFAYLAAYPLLAAGLLAADRARTLSRWRTLLDGLLVTAALLLVSWTTVLGATVAAAVEEEPLTAAVGTAYPVLDAVLATVALLLLARARGRSGPLVLLGAGHLLLAVVDGVYLLQELEGTYASGGPLDAGWFTYYLVVALAATVRSDAVGDDAPVLSRLATVLPYLAAVVAAAALAGTLLSGGTPDAVLLWLAGAVAAGVVLRQALVVADNAALARRLIATQEELRGREEHFRSLVHGASEVITLLDADWKVRWVSPSVQAVLGHRPEDLEGHAVAGLVHPEDRHLANARWRRAQDGRHDPYAPGSALALRLRHRDGRWLDTESVLTDHTATPSVRGLVMHTRDVSERTALESRLTTMAFTDELTGLANRARLTDRLTHAVEVGQRSGGVALVYADLDGFKGVNDSLGHEAGDRILRETGRRLLGCLRSGDTAARLGGDEFAVLLEQVDSVQQVRSLADRLLELLTEPYDLGEERVVLSTSIGIAVARPEDDASTLLRNADLAMYQAKADGKGRAVLYEPGMHTEAVRRLELERDLRSALDRGELAVAYQPIVDLASGEVVSVEALLRWRHPERGDVPPLEFVPLAEETGLIHAIGAWVLRTACAQLASWRRAGHPLSLTVNVSGRQLQDPGLADVVAAALAEHDLPARLLTLEITESVLVHDAAVERLHELHALGVHLALDDFGTGWSSLSYLQLLPVDTVKIDRSFVRGLGAAGAEGGDASLMRAILMLSEELHLQLVAEGVEEAEQARWLDRAGCRRAQGWLFAKALPPGELDALLAGGPLPVPGVVPA